MEHRYEDHIETFGERVKKALSEGDSETVVDAAEDKVAELEDGEEELEAADYTDPLGRETAKESMDRELAALMGDKTAAQKLRVELLRQDIEELREPGLDIDQFITAARNG